MRQAVINHCDLLSVAGGGTADIQESSLSRLSTSSEQGYGLIYRLVVKPKLVSCTLQRGNHCHCRRRTASFVERECYVGLRLRDRATHPHVKKSNRRFRHGREHQSSCFKLVTRFRAKPLGRLAHSLAGELAQSLGRLDRRMPFRRFRIYQHVIRQDLFEFRALGHCILPLAVSMRHHVNALLNLVHCRFDTHSSGDDFNSSLVAFLTPAKHVGHCGGFVGRPGCGGRTDRPGPCAQGRPKFVVQSRPATECDQRDEAGDGNSDCNFRPAPTAQKSSEIGTQLAAAGKHLFVQTYVKSETWYVKK